MGSRRRIILPATRMVPSASAVGQALPASVMASVNKDRIYFEERAQIPHGRTMLAQVSAKVVSYPGS
jgi:hypothetical protein